MASGQKQKGARARKKPLWIFYDSEAANGNVYYGDIIEIAAKCHPGIVKGQFESLINTNQELGAFALHKCGFTQDDFIGKPSFKDVLRKFLLWIDDMVRLASKNGTKYFPVICAHNAFGFDCQILLGNMERFGLNYKMLQEHNVHFADSFLLCKKLKERGDLGNVCLSLDALFTFFFPTEKFKARHRAMGDVNAMIKIFVQTPLNKQLHHMPISTTAQRLKYYCIQSSTKEQQLILEDKLSKLDACSKNMSVKKLLRDGITYDQLKVIFERSSSFMEFFQYLKERGIERKVAKIIALQLSGIGLQNQGYEEDIKDGKTLEVLDSANIMNDSTSFQSFTNDSLVGVECPRDTQPESPADLHIETAFNVNGEKCVESWDEEIEGAEISNNFVLSLSKAIPISVMLDDVYHSSSGRSKGNKVGASPNKREKDVYHSSRDQSKVCRAQNKSDTSFKTQKCHKQSNENDLQSSYRAKEDLSPEKMGKEIYVTIYVGDIAIDVPCETSSKVKESGFVENDFKNGETSSSPTELSTITDNCESFDSVEHHSSDESSSTMTIPNVKSQCSGESQRSCKGSCKCFTFLADGLVQEPYKAFQTTGSTHNPDEGNTNSELLANTKFSEPDSVKKISIYTEERIDDYLQRNEKDFKLRSEENETTIVLNEKSDDGIKSVDEKPQDGYSCFEEPNENSTNIIKHDTLELPNATQLEFSHTINRTGPQMVGCYDQSYMSYTSPWILRENGFQPMQYHSAPLHQGFIRPHMLHPSQIVYPRAVNFHGNHFVSHGLWSCPSQVPVYGQGEETMFFSSSVTRSNHKSPYYRHEIRRDTYRVPQRSPSSTTTSDIEMASSVNRTILSTKETNIRERPLSDDGKFTLAKQLKETRQENTNKGSSFLSCSLQSVEKSYECVSNGAPLDDKNNGGRVKNAGDVDKLPGDKKVDSETDYKQERLNPVICSSAKISKRMHISESMCMATKKGLSKTSLDLPFVEQFVPDENKKVLANPSSTVSCDRNSNDKNIGDSKRWLRGNPSNNTSNHGRSRDRFNSVFKTTITTDRESNRHEKPCRVKSDKKYIYGISA